MKITRIPLLLSFLTILMLGHLSFCSNETDSKSGEIIAEQAIAETSEISWFNMEEGISKAKKENKYVMISFYTDWCHWCKVMERVTFKDPKVVSYLNSRYVAVKINPEKTETIRYKKQNIPAYEFFRAVGGTGFPTVTFLDNSGNLITSVPGYIQTEVFIPLMRFIRDDCYEQMSFPDYQTGKVCN